MIFIFVPWFLSLRYKYKPLLLYVCLVSSSFFSAKPKWLIMAVNLGRSGWTLYALDLWPGPALPCTILHEPLFLGKPQFGCTYQFISINGKGRSSTKLIEIINLPCGGTKKDQIALSEWTRPNVNYAKVWLNHSFLCPGLVWSQKEFHFGCDHQCTIG